MDTVVVFTSSDFPCAFRPTGNDRTQQLRPAVSFNQLGVSKFHIDSWSWPIKVNKRTRIQTCDTRCRGWQKKQNKTKQKNSSHVRRLYCCFTLNTEMKSHQFISTRKFKTKTSNSNHILQCSAEEILTNMDFCFTGRLLVSAFVSVTDLKRPVTC